MSCCWQLAGLEESTYYKDTSIFALKYCALSGGTRRLIQTYKKFNGCRNRHQVRRAHQGSRNKISGLELFLKLLLCFFFRFSFARALACDTLLKLAVLIPNFASLFKVIIFQDLITNKQFSDFSRNQLDIQMLGRYQLPNFIILVNQK